jgi:adenylate kinase family enzyme
MRDAEIKLDYVLEIAVDDAKIIERLAGRRVHPAAAARMTVKQLDDVSELLGAQYMHLLTEYVPGKFAA